MADSGNVFEQPGLLAILLAAFTGFIGWRVGTAKDSVRIENHEAQIKVMAGQIAELVKADNAESKDLAAHLATIGANLTSVAETLARLDQRISRLEDKRP